MTINIFAGVLCHERHDEQKHLTTHVLLTCFWCVASQDSGYLCILTVLITEKSKLQFSYLHMRFTRHQFQGLYS